MLFENVYYFGDDLSFHKGCVTVENGRIAGISEPKPHGGSEIKYLIPGLVDLHCHGNSGVDFSDGDYGALKVMARRLAENGITSFSPASMTVPEAALKKAYTAAAKLKREAPQGLSKLRGITMEGPFLSEQYRGAQWGDCLQSPDEALFDRLNEAAEGLIRIVCVAPELDGAEAFIRSVSKKAVVAIAHTAADYETAASAIQNGASHVTHLFNAMPPMLHREPGVVGAAAESGGVTAELICDGVHIHESAVRAAFRLFGPERIVLISDSVRACGMSDGEYTLGGQRIQKKGDVAVLADGTLAGSVTYLSDCMKKAISFGIPAEHAVRAASYNPAAVLGIRNEVGTVAKGKCADLVLLSADFTIETVYSDGIPILKK